MLVIKLYYFFPLNINHIKIKYLQIIYFNMNDKMIKISFFRHTPHIHLKFILNTFWRRDIKNK